MDAHHEINALMCRYADLIDAGDFVGVGALFVRGSLLAPDGTTIASGSDEVTALYESTTTRHDDGTPGTAHLLSNVVIHVDEDAGTATARSRSRFTVLQARPGFELRPVVTGRYDDTFTRLDGLWSFTTRQMSPTLLGDLSHHLSFDLDAGR